MTRTLIAALALGAALAWPAAAETIEVRMLNVGADGERMVFEPSYLRARPGDVLVFRAVDRGHNAESADGLIPEGAEAFTGRINEEIEVTLDAEGLYAIICKPHYAMGMVMTVAVGDAAPPEGFLEGRIPRKARQRFEAQLAELAAQ